MFSPPAVGMKSPALNRFGGYSQGATSPVSPTGVGAANEADATKWYESGPFWVLVFLFSGYILMYRVLK